MTHNYLMINKRIRDTGLFSEYLPTCFNLNPNAFVKIPTENCDLIEPYCFSMSRFNESDARRNVFIPEIGSYAVVHSFMRDNDIIKEIIEFTEKSYHSYSPMLGIQDTIIRHEQSYGSEIHVNDEEKTSNYISNVTKKIIQSTGAKKVLKLDIASCFSTFYTHMIPAILLGAEQVKVEYSKDLSGDNSIDPLYIKYKKLDSIIRKQMQNRTNGLLVGPLSSKLIVEGLLTRIDLELDELKLNFSRYVDDYEIYLYEDNEKEVISSVAKVLRGYNFSLNAEKTQIVEYPYYIIENFAKVIEDYREKASIEDIDIIKLFNEFLTFEKNGAKGAVRFLLKSIEKKPIAKKNNELYKSYLLSILCNNERSITKTCSLLIQYNNENPLTKNDFKLLKEMLSKHLDCSHDLEVVWILFVLIECDGLKQSKRCIKEILKTENELAKIMLLRKGFLSNEEINQVSIAAKSWLLLYELFIDNFITEEFIVNKLSMNKNIAMYRKMKENNIHFCY